MYYEVYYVGDIDHIVEEARWYVHIAPAKWFGQRI